MNCKLINQQSIVGYLATLNFQPVKVIRNDHWYYSPFREEKTPSFKVEESRNIWYDHGLGKGGTLIDFLMLYFNCNAAKAIEFYKQHGGGISSFHSQEKRAKPEPIIQPVLEIKSVRTITNIYLLNYLRQRRIDLSIAREYLKEVDYEFNGKKYYALAFKNDAGGYELRNAFFKNSASPKFIKLISNGSKTLTVFEGFFDFLSYLSLKLELTDFLVLNSLSFFERSMLLMEKYDRIHLFLDNDHAGRLWTSQALKRSKKYQDGSYLYYGYKDLNDWLVAFGSGAKASLLSTAKAL